MVWEDRVYLVSYSVEEELDVVPELGRIGMPPYT